MIRETFFGPPGTGKTHRLLEEVQQELDAGTAPSRIAFVAFTKAAVEEALSRINRPTRELKWFRTLHSLAFQSLRMQRDGMLTDYTEFGNSIGLRFTEKNREGWDAEGMTLGDQLLATHALIAATQQPFSIVAREHNLDVTEHRYALFAERLEEFKKRRDLLEFHDLLARFIRADRPVPVEVAFIDEAQDLTAQQWQAVRIAFRDARRVAIAGDDDQAIYRWAGADVRSLLDFSENETVLSQSHRLPRSVHALAQLLSARITGRREKQFSPRDATGVVRRAVQLHELNLDLGTWLLLARNKFSLAALADHCRQRGFLYSQNGFLSAPPAAYKAWCVAMALRRGEAVEPKDIANLFIFCGLRPPKENKFIAPPIETRLYGRANYFLKLYARHGAKLPAPQIRITTIHQSKGDEAQHVAVVPDVSAAVWAALASPRMASDEHRAFYVAVTRAKECLYLLAPESDLYYEYA